MTWEYKWFLTKRQNAFPKFYYFFLHLLLWNQVILLSIKRRPTVSLFITWKIQLKIREQCITWCLIKTASYVKCNITLPRVRTAWPNVRTRYNIENVWIHSSASRNYYEDLLCRNLQPVLRYSTTESYFAVYFFYAFLPFFHFSIAFPCWNLPSYHTS